MSSLVDVRGSDVTFALHDPATALASLFRPVSKGRRPSGLKVESEFNGYRLMFTCFEGLDVRDQSILLAAVGIAGFDQLTIGANTEGEIGSKLWADLEPSDRAQAGSAVIATTTLYALMGAAGMPTRGDDYDRVKDILYRLSQVGCRVRKDGYDWSMRLLSYCANPDGTIHIALNERFATAMGAGEQSIRVSLDERRNISGETGQVLHAWLTAITRPGSKGVWMGLDAIAIRVWGVESKNGNTVRGRRALLLEALVEIEAQGWKVEQKGRGARHQVRLTRPKVMDT